MDLAELLSMTQEDRERALAEMSHEQLYNLRNLYTNNKAIQNLIAPFEHRAFAREAVKEQPLMAIPIGLATPAYSMYKQAFNTGARSSPSLAEISQAYRGIKEGLFK